MLQRAPVLSLIFLPLLAGAQTWEIQTITEHPTASPTVTRYSAEITGNPGATLQWVVFDSANVRVTLLDREEEPRTRSGSALPRTDAVAAVNAGYFHPDFRPVGLLVTEGETLNGMERAQLLSGVIAATNDRFFVLRGSEFRLGPKTRHALQTGPFLVDGGKLVEGLNDTKSARRTVVLSDGKGRFALLHTSSLTLRATGALLASGVLNESIRVQRALNLDGGSSSAFWVRNRDGSIFSRSELKSVRNFLLITPR